MKKITVIGTGYVGLVSGSGLADFGNKVLCVDLNEKRIKDLSIGKGPFFEPGLIELVERNKEAGRLDFNTNIEESISDADVGFHAICDSILGALSLRDIGYYFNNNNKKWKDANSVIFMKFAANKLIENNYYIVNLDLNFICETPNINKYFLKIRSKISKVLNISKKIISIKATTNEKIGFIGNGEGIAVESIVSIENV